MVDQVKLKRWSELQQMILDFKPVIDEEMALRKELAQALTEGRKGTFYENLAGGYRLKGVGKVDYKLDKTKIAAVNEALLERNVDISMFVVSEPKLVTKAVTEVEKLNPEVFAILADMLVSKPGTPTLEIVPPKPEEAAMPKGPENL
jgi:hypothetical protein